MFQVTEYLGHVFKYHEFKDRLENDEWVGRFLHTYGYEAASSFLMYDVAPQSMVAAYNAFERYDHVNISSRSSIQCAFKYFYHYFFPFVSGCGFINYDDAVRRMNLSTSPGYPWSIYYNTKQQYEIDCDFYNIYWHSLGTVDPIVSFSTVSVKEEVVPIRKVYENKPRTFMSVDHNHVVAGHQMFSHQNDNLHSNYQYHPIKVGISPFHLGWEKLFLYMCGDNITHGWEFDGKQWDSSMSVDVLQFIRDFRIFCFEVDGPLCTSDKLRVCNWYRNASSGPCVLPDGAVYWRQTGMPSGISTTIDDNSFALTMIVYVAWDKRVPEAFLNQAKLDKVAAFDKFVKMASIGDDLIVTASEVVHAFFNADVIIDVASELGYKLETPCVQARPLIELSFCSTSFIYEDGHILPQHDCHKIRASMLVKSRSQLFQSTIERLGGLKTVAWPCKSCRQWFRELEDFLRQQHPISGYDWSPVLSERELRNLYLSPQ